MTPIDMLDYLKVELDTKDPTEVINAYHDARVAGMPWSWVEFYEQNRTVQFPAYIERVFHQYLTRKLSRK